MDSFDLLTPGFSEAFGRLVVLIRTSPADVAGQKDALRAAVGMLRAGGCHIEGGIETEADRGGPTLRSRLLARNVEAIELAADAPAADLLALARALASDSDPIPSTEAVQVEVVGAAPAAPAAPVHPPRPTPVGETMPPMPPPVTDSGRSRTLAGPTEEAQTLTSAMESALGESRVMEALHAAQALCRLAARFPEHERRTFSLQLRRVFTRKLLEVFIQFAMRVPEERPRAIEVLREAGPEGVELMVDCVTESEVLGPRQFVFDALTRLPEAYPVIVPLLESGDWYRACHGAELLGRLGLPEALEPLRKALEHPDLRVRISAIDALAQLPGNAVADPLRRALGDASPQARASAAHGLARRHSVALAMPIAAALEEEKDPGAWREFCFALAGIDSHAAANTLATIALDRGTLLHRRPVSQRLTAIEALEHSTTGHATRALDRIVREGDATARSAAAAALARKG